MTKKIKKIQRNKNKFSFYLTRRVLLLYITFCFFRLTRLDEKGENIEKVRENQGKILRF